MIKKCLITLAAFLIPFLSCQASFQPGMTSSFYRPHITNLSYDRDSASLALSNGTVWQAANNPYEWRFAEYFSIGDSVIIEYSDEQLVTFSNPKNGLLISCFLIDFREEGMPTLTEVRMDGTVLSTSEGKVWHIPARYTYIAKKWRRYDSVAIFETMTKGMYQIINPAHIYSGKGIVIADQIRTLR